MKYLLLCALVIAGAFFSPVYSQQHNPCPHGGELLDGMCTMPAPLKNSCEITEINGRSFGGQVIYVGPDVEQYKATLSLFNTTATHQTCTSTGGTSNNSAYTFTTNFVFTCDMVPAGSSSVYIPYNVIRDTTTYTTKKITPTSCEFTETQETLTSSTHNMFVKVNFSDSYQCPPDGSVGAPFTQGPYVTESGQNLCFYPAIPAEPEPECDCANFAGDSLSSFNDLKVPVGTYTRENPPQCVEQRDYAAGRDEPLRCRCQVSAQKWTSSYGGFKDGVEYETWSTLPTEIGKPSGTFTGVKCGGTDGGPIEPEENAPKDCFTLKNGVKWCWADKAEKCQVVNGIEQCASGCGTVNGDFVCYDDTPVIPPKDRDNLTPPDDTLADPNKSINDMVKGDFKEINKGVESRLDNVVTSISNTTIAMDEVSDKVGLTNSKLDGIGMQLDGIGKQLGHIDGTLEGAFGDDGEPVPGTGDGETCHEDICSWYESAYPDGLVGIWQERSADLQQTPLFNFLNQLGTVQPTGGQPDFNICFNLGAMGDYGCKSFEIPSAVWAFIRLMILICAGIFCYRIVSGV